MLQDILNNTMTTLHEAIDDNTPRLQPRETGTVVHVGGGIARVKGLPGLTSEELVQFPDHVLGVAINLEPDEIGVMLLGDSDQL
ncbi:MAG: F0F1 ATP synthase subunit alpha, partial [Gammaproteobacteria bacterium]